MFIIFILILETGLLLGVVGWVLFDIYREGRTQKIAALTLLEHMKSNQSSRVNTITKFLQNRLHLTGDEIKKQQQLFLHQEIDLIQSIMRMPSINDKSLLQMYAKLQALLLLYCSTKSPTQMNQAKIAQFENTYEECLSQCQDKFMSYLESKNLITDEIRDQIHSLDQPLAANKTTTNTTTNNNTTNAGPAADDKGKSKG